MKPPYHLVPGALSHDTVAALEALLADAKAGRLQGIAFGAIYRRRTYIVDAAGEAHRSPTFALGVVHMLAKELEGLAKP